MRSMARMAVLIGAVVGLAACGGDTGDGGGTSTDTLTMVDNAFEPADVSVASGTELQLTNDGAALHNLTIEGTSIDQDVAAGERGSVTLDLEPGEYTVFCEYHRSAGMEGTVTIQ